VYDRSEWIQRIHIADTNNLGIEAWLFCIFLFFAHTVGSLVNNFFNFLLLRDSRLNVFGKTFQVSLSLRSLLVIENCWILTMERASWWHCRLQQV